MTDPAEYMRSAEPPRQKVIRRPAPSISAMLADAFVVAGKVAGSMLDKWERMARAEERTAAATERMADASERIVAALVRQV